MAEEKKVLEELKNLKVVVASLQGVMDERFEKLKKIISDYLTLGSEFAIGALRSSLEKV